MVHLPELICHQSTQIDPMMWDKQGDGTLLTLPYDLSSHLPCDTELLSETIYYSGDVAYANAEQAVLE